MPSKYRQSLCHCLQKIACAVLIPCDVQSLWKWPPTIKACNGTWSRLVCSRWWPCPVGCNFKVLMAASPESVLWECFNDKWYPDFLQGSSLRVTILLQSYKYNLYTNIYVSIIYWYVYIYKYAHMHCTVSRAATPSPSLSSNRPLGLPSGVDGNNLTKLVRLSYNDWSLCSASVNQIQSLCLFSNKSLSGSAFTLKDLSLLLLQRSQFRPEIMTKWPKARSHRMSYGKDHQIQEVVKT